MSQQLVKETTTVDGHKNHILRKPIKWDSAREITSVRSDNMVGVDVTVRGEKKNIFVDLSSVLSQCPDFGSIAGQILI